jgi:hypothetical protein
MEFKMDIWVVCDVYESEYDFSTHLTEKGALLSVCKKVLSFMHLDFDIETRNNAELLAGWEAKCAELLVNDLPPPKFDIANWQDMHTPELWKFYNFISEFVWESSTCDFTIARTQVTV